MEIVYLVVGLVVGAIVAFFYVKMKSQKGLSDAENIWREKEQTFQDQKVEAEKQSMIWEERFQLLKVESEEWKADLEKYRSENTILVGRLEKAKVEYLNLKEKLETQKVELEGIQKKFTTEFENVANKILEKNSEKFTAANQKNIGDVLNPLKEKIKDFEEKVESTYKQGLKDQTELRAELIKLHDLNSKISEEASNLTKALKGDVKKQGNWGEVVLERILERSGDRKSVV